jgi:SAM-dependent methyltransferase
VPSVAALRGTEIGRYVGIDMSRALLDLARAELAALGCPVTLVEGDYRIALADWQDTVDVVWIGQSLHHMEADEKLPVMRQVRRILASGGLFLIWEPTSLPGEDRFGWQTRVDAYVATWSGLDADERRMVVEHGWASDYPETAKRWLELGREAGFAAAEALLEAPPRLGTVYKFQA